MEAIANFFVSTGFYQFFQGDNWKSAIMLVIAVVLLFLGIVKKFEPLLLVPIAFGMLVTNLPGAEMFHEILFAGDTSTGTCSAASPSRHSSSRKCWQTAYLPICSSLTPTP